LVSIYEHFVYRPVAGEFYTKTLGNFSLINRIILCKCILGASPKLDLAQKIQQNIAINQQGQVKVIPQTTSIASLVKGAVPPNVTIQTKPELQV
jgi:hypothetical protein